MDKKSESVMKAGSENVESTKKINYDIDKLFIKAEELEKVKGLRCELWGKSGVGKTFAALSFPKPIYYIDTDGGVTLNMKYYKGKDVKILECYETLDTVSGDDNQPFDVDPIKSLEKFDYATKALADNEGLTGTVVIDTITDIWSWIGTWLNRKTEKSVSSKGTEYMSRFAWGDANNRYDWLMKRLKKMNTNLVVVSRAKSVYDSNGNITAQEQADAQKRTDYYMDFVINMKQRFEKVNGKTSSKRVGVVNKSRGLNLSDPIIEDFSYDKLKKLIDEDSHK